jgi:hypothetical protein
MENYIVIDREDPLCGCLVKVIGEAGYTHYEIKLITVPPNSVFTVGERMLCMCSSLMPFDDAVTVARMCLTCGVGMDTGFLIGDDGYMCEECDSKGELDKVLSDLGYESRQEAYERNVFLAMDWHENDYDYVYHEDSDSLIKINFHIPDFLD